jgi:Protein kinase domain
MPLSAGTRLGPYEVLAPIGAGGMGEVYRARDTKLDRDVAIKVLPAALAQDPERLARFEREAKVLAALNHPNIAQIYGVEESGGVRALVMELVPGEPLKGPLPLETALNYAKQIADALEAAHEKGIVHRDLKPANIMITPAGVVKVLDFGLAAVPGQGDSGADPSISPTLTVSPTRAGMILGTAAYMGPEQARGQAVDRRADIWAFGVVLYEMLTGRQAFAGETITDVLAAVVTKEPEWDGVPVKVRRLLQSCLQKNPKQRLQAIGDWRLLIEDAPQTAPQVAPPRYRWMIVLAAAICVLVGAAMFFVGRRTSRTPSPSFQRVTFRRGTIDNGRFANGGKTIAYSASWDGNPYQVYSTQAENPESRDRQCAFTWRLAFGRNGASHCRDPGSSPDLGRNAKTSSGRYCVGRLGIRRPAPRGGAVQTGISAARVSHRQRLVPDHRRHWQSAAFAQKGSNRLFGFSIREWRQLWPWLRCHGRLEGKQEDAHGLLVGLRQRARVVALQR